MLDSMDILTHPLSSHVWRTGPICSLEQHHRCHRVIFGHCAFGTRGSCAPNKSPCATRFRISGQGLASRLQTVERFVEPCSLFVSKHAAVPSAPVLSLLPCSGTQCGVDGRTAVPSNVWHQWLDKISQPCRLGHFAPHHQEIVITGVEDAFRGVSMAESCCSQRQALAPGTAQLDRVVGRICFGPQRSVFQVKKHLMTGADSL